MPPVPSYDLYVLGVQWANTICIEEGSTCEEKLKIVPKNHMTIKGLWPNKRNGKIVPICNQGDEIPIIDDGSSTFVEARQYWPSLTNKTNADLWTYEYNRYGYCYSNKIQDFDYKRYFQKTLDILKSKNITTLILDTFEEQKGEYILSLSTLKSKLENKLGGKYFHLFCKYIKGKQYLQEIRLSFNLNFNYVISSYRDVCNFNDDIILYYS